MKRNLPKSGFTLVELLVVITIIAILIALLLPAVQMAREAARKIECNNHIKELALACITHEQQHKILPTGGWGYWWFGDPDRGFDHHQPGGWVYNILPFIDQAVLHDVGSGMTTAAKRNELIKVAQTPLNVLHCPTRRQPILYPNTYTPDNMNAVPNGLAARTDYAGNGGTYFDSNDFWRFPWGIGNDPVLIDTPSFTWPSVKGFNGVFYPTSEVHLYDIIDGASNTYLIGEKYLNADAYMDGSDPADNNAIYDGYDWDHIRWSPAYIDSNGKKHYSYLPSQDTPGWSDQIMFGSAHPTSFNMSLCDGSVRTVSYNVDDITHGRMCERNDGLPIDGKNIEQ